jgi:lipopolysaccharide transport system ATP-binding protein
MSDIAIKVENLGKLYRLGEVGTGTISHDLNRWWARVRGKEDPYAKIGETNDRTARGNSDYVWSLKDVNFEVKQGEVLGIIGRNGAGKSTLLKLLSKVTSPTTGRIKVNGRIASLLEVGTGFHPELTGRENIFLNGAILGMTKAEIRSKFDEIVEFAGVERYIDTPVKRYSSGMYVRLAFAVAAFLEPEILIVDEVLAVGDAEFQKKCLGRMKDVSVNDGRTVLFVSHNMAAIKQLCNNSILLQKGTVKLIGSSDEVIKQYLQSAGTSSIYIQEWINKERPRNNNAEINKVIVCDSRNQLIETIYTNSSIKINIYYSLIRENVYVGFCLVCMNEEEQVIFSTINNIQNEFYGKSLKKGDYITSCNIPGNFFNNGVYKIRIILFSESFTDPVVVDEALILEIHDSDEIRGDFFGRIDGVIRPYLVWESRNNYSLDNNLK